MVFTYALTLFLGYSHADDNFARFEHWKKQCQEAERGTLNIDFGKYNDPLLNSYLFKCAVSIIVPDLSLISGKSKSKEKWLAEKMKKVKIADAFLSKGIDPNYKNEYGDTLLMLVVYSYLPNKWKEDTVRALIEKGVDMDEKNSNGYTVRDIAEYREAYGVIKILSEYEK